MLIALIPVAVLIVGLLMYVLATNTKVQEMGKILFFCGALVLTMTLSHETLKLG